jgi:hypothetical protein
MSESPLSLDLRNWLAAEVAQVEALLQGSGPTCQLDRKHASPPSLKALEGRYFVLRRATRLLETAQPLQALAAEAEKASAVLAADSGLARQADWVAYSQSVLEAVRAVQDRAGTAWTVASDPAGALPRRA